MPGMFLKSATPATPATEEPAETMHLSPDMDGVELLIFTHREGLLSSVAHDLKIRATRFAVEFEDGDPSCIEATFDAASLEVICAMNEGHEDPTALSEKNKAEIQEIIVKRILEAERYPQIRFRTLSITPQDEGHHQLTGILWLHGHERRLEFQTRVEDNRHVSRIRLHQPDYGIRPYSALLGAIRVQPDITVKITIPCDLIKKMPVVPKKEECLP